MAASLSPQRAMAAGWLVSRSTRQGLCPFHLCARALVELAKALAVSFVATASGTPLAGASRGLEFLAAGPYLRLVSRAWEAFGMMAVSGLQCLRGWLAHALVFRWRRRTNECVVTWVHARSSRLPTWWYREWWHVCRVAGLSFQ